MYKISKMMSNALIIALLIVVVVMLARQGSSGYEGAPLETKPTGNAARGPQSIFEIKSSLECTPGPSANASYYTNGLTPGGLCGDGEFVKGQLRDFDIENGIGGSLLEK